MKPRLRVWDATVIADVLTSVSVIWISAMHYSRTGAHHGALLSDEQKAAHTVAKDYYQPYSVAWGVRDAIQGPDDQKTMAFPILPNVQYEYEGEFGLLLNTNVTISGWPAV